MFTVRTDVDERRYRKSRTGYYSDGKKILKMIRYMNQVINFYFEKNAILG